MSDQYPAPPPPPGEPVGSAPPPPPAPSPSEAPAQPPAPTYDAAPPAPPAYAAAPVAPMGQSMGQPTGMGPIGQVRSTGTAILLFIVTFGIYGLFWYFKVHEEMKRHSGQGIGGAIALVIGLFVGIVMAFLTPAEVGGLYERRGQAKPVSGITGLWLLLPIVGGIVWFVKTNGALNDYWKSLGAQG